jgi:hypothetical protein
MPANAQNLIESFADVEGATRYAYSTQDTGAYLFEIPGGSVGTTLLLPDDPNDGDWYELADVDGSCSSTHPVHVVAGAGATILGGMTYTFTAAFASGKVRYVGRARAWVFIAGPGSGDLTAVDAGAGISVSTTGGVATVSNTGTLGVDAGTGIAVATVSGVATVSNTGTLGVDAGTGIAVATVSGVATVSNAGILGVDAGTGISVAVVSGVATVTNTAPATAPPAFSVNEAANNSDVPIATTSTLIAEFTEAVPDNATLIFIQACATFANTSEDAAVGSDVTLSIFVDGLAISVRAAQPDTLAVGSNFCCTPVQFNLSLAAGSHVFAIYGTATGDVGNCKVPANQGNIHAFFYG